MGSELWAKGPLPQAGAQGRYRGAVPPPMFSECGICPITILRWLTISAIWWLTTILWWLTISAIWWLTTSLWWLTISAIWWLPWLLITRWCHPIAHPAKKPQPTRAVSFPSQEDKHA